MKKTRRALVFKRASFLMVIFVCLGISSCASTQKESVAKIDTFGKSFNTKLSRFLGTKSQTVSQEDRRLKKRVVGQKVARKPRSPLIHGFIYDVSQADKFIFFYRGQDPKSMKLGETLKKYADETGMRIESYIVDHRSLPIFPKSVFANQEIIEKYFGSVDADVKAPTLFLAKYDSYASLISTGEISYLELINRMNKEAEERIARKQRKY